MRGGQSIKGLGLLAVHGPEQAGGHGCSTKHEGALSPGTDAAAAHALRRAPCHGPNGNACDCSQPPQDLCAPPSVSSSLRPTWRSRCMCRKQSAIVRAMPDAQSRAKPRGACTQIQQRHGLARALCNARRDACDASG